MAAAMAKCLSCSFGRMSRSYRLALLIMLPIGAWTLGAPQAVAQYQRAVDVVPSPNDIGGGYETPPVQRPLPRDAWWGAVDVSVFVLSLGLSAWIILRRRSRRWFVVLTIACLLYFGFYRQGCVCPIGAIQNVVVALTDSAYAIPYPVIVFFLLPLGLAFLFGRVLCGGVCPLGAVQELVLLKPIQVPRRLDRTLGLLKYLYLGVAVYFAARPAVERDFVICRFDPFVGMFRLNGPGGVLIFGAVLLIAGMFLGRPYCRYLCPYGALLAIVSRVSWRGVNIAGEKELDCGLCANACPYGAIEKMRAVRSSCLFCARCYEACPRDIVAPSRDAAGPVDAKDGTE